MKRKRRLEKGIASLDEQVKLHEEKRKRAMELGQKELVGYYEKEINELINARDKKKNILDKQ